MAAPTRSPATALFWRLLLLNALVLVIAAAAAGVHARAPVCMVHRPEMGAAPDGRARSRR